MMSIDMTSVGIWGECSIFWYIFQSGPGLVHFAKFGKMYQTAPWQCHCRGVQPVPLASNQTSAGIIDMFDIWHSRLDMTFC